jgi:tetratricopeptide (TPR) repeat protein
VSDLFERLRNALSDRYAVERELGHGGMATVFLAHDRKHERPVAIKVLGHDVAEQLGAERFLREIKTAAQLNHPNVLPLYDSGEADGLLYYVMPFVDGGSLRDRLDREGPLPIEAALRIAQEVAEALDHAHGLGIIHRDIKPENILFLSGRPVVADFGIARAVSGGGRQQLTQTGMAIGTPAYMSPEQAVGDPHLDGRSDVYALGCVLYEMLSGHPPFMGTTPREVIARHTVDAVPPLRTARPTISAKVDETITRALAKVPADRFANAHEFAEALAGRLAARAEGRARGAVLARLVQGPGLGVAGGYAVVGVLVWLAVRWLAGRFALSPHVADLTLAALGLLLPAVLMVAAVLSKRVRWRAAHTAGVFANVIVGGVVVALLFRGKDLGAATMAVTLTDENGQQVARVIPKAEFRKRVALFYFDADPADSLSRLMAYGIPDALNIDLLQDLFVDLRVPGNFRDQLREAGLRDLTGVSLAKAQEIATQQFRDQFITGSVRRENGEYVVTMTVYETATGEQLVRSEVRGADPLTIVDQLATDVRGTVKVPEGYKGKQLDLPAAELLTKRPAAFANFARAQQALNVRDDWAGGESFLERAVAADSTFALAQYELYITRSFQNRAQEGRAALQAAVDNVIRLPERVRNQIKANYYELRQEPEKMYAVIEMNAELFPTDIVALTALAQIQNLRGRRADAIATYRRILAVDPQQQDYLRGIAELQRSLGQYDSALATYQQYTALNPTDRRGYLGVGDLQDVRGEHDAAKQSYERVLLDAPRDVEALLRIADLELDVGRFDSARTYYTEAMAAARTPGDSADAYGSWSRYYLARGQVREAVRQRELGWTLRARVAPPIQLMIQRLQGVGDFIAIGDTARSLALLQQYRRDLKPPFDAFLPLGELDVALELEAPDRIDSAAAAIEQVIAERSYAFLKPNAVYGRGQAHYLRGEFREAIANWEEEQQLNPNDGTVPRQLGQAYRGLSEYDKAEAEFEEALRRRPSDARAMYEVALLDEVRGRHEEAITRLRGALQVWAEADASYKWAHRAREMLARLDPGH